MSFFLSLIWFLFVFCLGGVCFLAAAAGGAWHVLRTLSKKSEEKKKALLLQRAQEIAGESQKAVSVLMPELKSKAKVTLGERKTKGEVKNLPWSIIVLKSNMLFRFQGEESTTGSICRLDGCSIKVSQHRTKARWSHKSALEISTTDDHDLWTDEPGKTCYLYFSLGREAEQWFHALRRASGLTEVKEAVVVDKLQLEHRYFSHLSSNVQYSGEVNADWFNAILGRVFWGIHDQPLFLDFVKSKLGRKISKLKMPSVVESIKLTEVQFGPNMPLFSNIKLNSFTPLGAMNADGDVHYHGGFFFRIDIQLKIKVPVTKNVICVPVRVGCTIKTVSGRMNFQCAPPPAGRGWIAFYGEPNVDLDISTDIGSFSSFKLANIPHLMNIIINKTKAQLIKKMVVPVMDDYPIPKIPKKAAKKAVGGNNDEATNTGDEKEKEKEREKEKEKEKGKGKDKEKDKERDEKDSEKDKVPPLPQRSHSSPSSHLTQRKVYQPHSAAIPPAVPRRTHVQPEKLEKRKTMPPKVQEMKPMSKAPQELKPLKDKPTKPTSLADTTGQKQHSASPTPIMKSNSSEALLSPPLPIRKSEPGATSAPIAGLSPRPTSNVPEDGLLETVPRLSTSPSEGSIPSLVDSSLRASVPGLFEEPTTPLFDKRSSDTLKRDNGLVDFSTPTLFGPSDRRGKEPPKDKVSASKTEKKETENKEPVTEGNMETAKQKKTPEITIPPAEAEDHPTGNEQSKEPDTAPTPVPGEGNNKTEPKQEQQDQSGEGFNEEHKTTETKPVEKNEETAGEKPKSSTKVDSSTKPPTESRDSLSKEPDSVGHPGENGHSEAERTDAGPSAPPSKGSLFPDPPSPLFSAGSKVFTSKGYSPVPLFGPGGGSLLFPDEPPTFDTQKSELPIENGASGSSGDGHLLSEKSQQNPPPLPKRPADPLGGTLPPFLVTPPPLPVRTHLQQSSPPQSPVPQPQRNGNPPNPTLPQLPARPPSTVSSPSTPYPVAGPAPTAPVPVPTPVSMSSSVLSDNPLAVLATQHDDEEDDDDSYAAPEQPVYARYVFEAEMKEKEKAKNVSTSSSSGVDSKKFRTTSPLLATDPFGSLPFVAPTAPLSQSGPVTSKPPSKPAPPSRKPPSTSPPGHQSVFNKDFFGNIFNNMEGKVDFLKEKVEVLKEKAETNGADWFFSDAKKKENKQL